MTETTDTIWTVSALLRTTRDLLAQRGLESPRLDGELLLGHVLGLSRTQLYMYGDREVDTEQRDAFRELVRRRLRGEPIAYLLGRRGFWNLELRVDPRVLIPRPETEHVVEQVLAYTAGRKYAPWKIVDVGTGSGALALALASELPNATVVAIDASADALAVAAQNAELLGLRDRVKLVRGDLLEPIVRAGARVHIVVSNPPYVGEDDGAELEAGVRDHEPHMALFAGRDGLALIKRLLPQTAAVLEPGGLFVCEHGTAQGEAVRALAAPHFASVRTERDLAGHDRLLRAQAAGSLALPLDPAPGAEAPAIAEPEAPAVEVDGDAAPDALALAIAEGLEIIDVRSR